MRVNSQAIIIILLLCFGVPRLAEAAERTLSLEAYLDLVRGQSPELKAEKAGQEAASARASGVRIMPPMVGLMQMREGGESTPGIEISQELPFPTKITGEKSARSREAEAVKEKSRLDSASVLWEAQKAYVSYWAAYEKRRILIEKKTSLLSHVRLVRAATRSDVEGQLHLLEAEAQIDMVESEVLAMDGELAEMRSELSVYAPSLSALGVGAGNPDTANTGHVDSSGVASDEIIPVEPELSKIKAEGAQGGPLVSAMKKDLEAREAMESLARQSYAPDFFLRFRQFQASEMRPSNQEIMVGISLPFLYTWQPRAEVAESSANRMKAQAMYDKARIEADSKTASLVAKAKALKGQVAVLRDKLIPRAARRMRLIGALSQRGVEGLEEHRSVMIEYLDLRMKAVDLMAEHERLAADVYKITGHSSGTGAP